MLWEAATSSDHVFDPRPWEEIAKLYEHQRRDFTAARAMVEEALARAETHRVPDRVLGALQHRLDRLTRRLAAGLGDRLEQRDRHVFADQRRRLQQALVLGRQPVDARR